MKGQALARIAPLFALVFAWGAAGATGAALDVDFRSLVSQADLHYDRPVARSEEGMPIGNGRMGTLAWTVPEALRLQINRVDVFGSGRGSNSFSERNTDYCGGCGFVDLDFSVSAEDVFPAVGTTQHLSKMAVTAAMMGRADHVKYLVPNQVQSAESPVLANRMDLREGTQTTSVQRLGRATDALHNALCQSVPSRPGGAARDSSLPRLAARVGRRLHAARARGVSGERLDDERTNRVRGNSLTGRRRMSLAQSLGGGSR